MKLETIWRRALAAAALAAGLASGRAAPADDFTFNVPVELHNIPSRAGTAQVDCQALGEGGGPEIGRGSSPIPWPLTNGSYQGTVIVHFNATGGPLQNAKGYVCRLAFRKMDGTWGPPPTHRQGTPYSDEIRGPINP